MFLLVAAYPGSPGQKAVCVCVYSIFIVILVLQMMFQSVSAD